MPELRQNVATREWVIIATERARRPEEFVLPRTSRKELPSYAPNCPFCPGNDAMLLPEVSSVRDAEGRWLARVVPNKYPALAREGELRYGEADARRWMTGVGIHDVIVETPRHDLSPALLEPAQLLHVLTLYRERYLAASADERIELVTIFKNHGPGAGTSLAHPHSQMVATPVVPQHIRARMSEAMAYYDDHHRCVFCQMLEDELRSRERVVAESQHFVAFVLYAALSPFHIWLLPKRHMSAFPEMDDDEMRDLAAVLQDMLRRLYLGLDDPDYNYVVRSLPGRPRSNRFFHWYLAIIPRVSQAAGFELGSGVFINTALPEASAAFLRNVKI